MQSEVKWRQLNDRSVPIYSEENTEKSHKISFINGWKLIQMNNESTYVDGF